jgi:dipeptidyl aminopeptidase/acylaminoacyl peptidase
VPLAHGEDNSRVLSSQFKKMRGAGEKAAMPVELLEIEDEGHSFSKPENEQKWYDTLIAFLAKHNPAE